MRYIAHRGLIDGPNVNIENHPDTLSYAWKLGYLCEVDVWMVDNKIYCGHDKPQYEVTQQFIVDNSSRSWYHCKNFEALKFFSEQMLVMFNFFWHENDKFTLTSLGYVWTFPNNPLGHESVCVLPELFMPLEECVVLNCAGICSDYIGTIRHLRGDQ